MAAALAVRELGEGPALVILHGLLGAGRNWQSIGKQLARHHRVILPDLRNHGHSPWTDEMTYPAVADDLVRLLDRLGLASAVVIGHSMGGKAAMTMALLHPDRVGRLGVVDIAPVAYAGAGSEPFVEAMLAVPPEALARRADADAALSAAVGDPGIRAFLLQNLSIGSTHPGWQPNLAVLHAQMPNMVGFPQLSRPYEGIACFIRGARSDYVLDSHWPEITRLFPKASLITVPGAGHWVHAEAPDAVLAAIRDLIAS
jgi:pimeloyl-ACP methyl ester carboxylesterase